MAEIAQIKTLTSLRGIAAWLVVLFHAREIVPMLPQLERALGHGYLAVDFFFVLSGFVIALNYRSVVDPFSGRAYLQYLSRRLARIYPLHFVLLTAYLLTPAAILIFSQSKALGERYGVASFVASIFLVQNWGFTEILTWNIPSWSISTELAAYLLFPAILLLVDRICAQRGGYLLTAVMITCLLSLFFWMSSLDNIGRSIPTHGLARCICEFSIGVMAAKYFTEFRASVAGMRFYFLGSALCACAIGAQLGLPNYTYIPVSFGLAVLYFASENGRDIPFLHWQPLVYLGDISYSTYLVHYLIKDWIKFCVVEVSLFDAAAYLLLVFLSSILLFRMVEVPGRHWFVKRTGFRFA
jgi:peptidoglycan/LPS O-acetylase OafA/YrhL